MRFEHHSEIDSTSAEAARRGRAGDIDPVWIQADVQTKGVGRRGRAWSSRSGNLFCTGLFPIEGELAQAAKLSYAAALAVIETCDAYVAPETLALKWPNDVLLGGAKVAGILLESGTGPRGAWMSVGVGINLLTHPSDTPYPATNLAAHMRTQDPEAIPNSMSALAVLSERFTHWCSLYARAGFAPLQAVWSARAAGIGGSVTANLMSETLTGTLLGLSAQGELEVRLPDGRVRHISSGEVFLG